MADSWDEKSVFLEALKLPPAERDRYLAAACSDAEQRRRIEALLAAHAEGLTSVFEASASSTEPEPVSSDYIDEFQLVKPIGKGGMGVVYLAKDTILGRRVAVKVLAPELTGSEAALGRFRDEARHAAALRHPAIVPVHKFGFDGRVHYIVSEFVEGQTLAALIAEEAARRKIETSTQLEKLWFRRCAEILAVIADALEHSHRAGIIHRDVKPSNILLDSVHGPRLTDFGIAKYLAGATESTQTSLIGSCHYMSPEQAAVSSQPIDQRSDVFSLGVVLYEMIAFKRPFDGRDVSQILRAVIEQAPVRLRKLNPRVPTDLEVICHKALEKLPRDRYQSAAHFGADLRSALAGVPILARPPSAFRRVGHVLKRRKLAVLAGAGIAIILVISLLAARSVQMARDESFAWVFIDSRGDPCRAIIRQTNGDSRSDDGAVQTLVPEPGEAIKLEPGHYRVTLVRQRDSWFCEFNLLHTQQGSRAARTLLLAGPREPYPPAAIPQSIQDRPPILVGVLHSPSDSADEMLPVSGGVYELERGANAESLMGGSKRVARFQINRTKVTNAEFAEFATVTGYRRPAFWRDADPATILDRPVVGVTLEDAEAYARWRGKRLPSVVEWQAAARGPTGNLYPGGDQPPALPEPPVALRDAVATSQAAAQSAAYRENARPVSEDDGLQVRDGLLQMFSNVRELTGSVSQANHSTVVCGRAWFDPIAARTLANTVQGPLLFPAPHHGFRCVRSDFVSLDIDSNREGANE